MKNIIFVFALTALFAVQVSAAPLRCDEKCIYNYCYAPYPNNQSKSTQCVQDARNTLDLIQKTCQKQDYSISCVKSRITTDKAFLNFYGCMQDCYPNGIQVEQSPIAGKIHDLTKSRKRGQDTTTPPTVPPTVPPTKPTQPDTTPKPTDKTKGSQILNCFIGLVSVFLGVLIF